LGVDLTSGWSSEQRSGPAGRRRRTGDEEEVDLDGEEANPGGGTPTAPPQQQKKMEEDGRLHGVPAVDGAAARRSRSKAGKRR